MQKKVLIITYYWPLAGGPGVQRWLKFVKYLPNFGITPIVYVPENANYPIMDYSLLEEKLSNVTILRKPIKEPYKFANYLSKETKTLSKGLIPDKKKQSLSEQILLFIRGNFFIPDARKSWVKPSVAYLSDYIRENEIETIITTGPPHSLHLIGNRLKERHQIKWIADFRDPWTSIDYHKDLKLTKFARRKHKYLEKKILNNADNLIVTSESTKKEFQCITPKPVEVITNGYDTANIDEILELDSKFTLSHIGSLLSNRNPKVLWKVLSELVREDKNFAEALQLNFLGATSQEVIDSLKEYRLSDYINNIGYLSHNESVKFQKKSQVLLLIEADLEVKNSIIPGKLFEYMVSNRPILAIGPENWDVAPIIRNTNTGSTFKYLDYQEIKSKIIEYFESYKEEELRTNAIGLQQYSRKALTEKLSKLL